MVKKGKSKLISLLDNLKILSTKAWTASQSNLLMQIKILLQSKQIWLSLEYHNLQIFQAGPLIM